MLNPKLGNRIILLLFAATLAVGSFYAQWGTLKLTDRDWQDAYLDLNGEPVTGGPLFGLLKNVAGNLLKHIPIPVDGLHGSVVLFAFHFPIWVLPAAVLFALFMTVTNTSGFSDVPRWVVTGMAAVAAVLTVWEICYLARHGAVGWGGFLLLAAAFACRWAQRPVAPPPLLSAAAAPPTAPERPPTASDQA